MKKKVFIVLWLIVMAVSGYVLFDAYAYFTFPRAKFTKDRIILYYKKYF